MTLTGCTVSDNSSLGDGGGLCNLGGSMTLTDCTVSGNAADNGDGGGIGNFAGTVTLTDCTVSGNSAVNGGGIENTGTTTLAGCTVSGNSASGVGGGVYEIGGSMTLTDCTVSGNAGGGIHGPYEFDGTMTLIDCTVSDNTIGNGLYDRGGGLYNRGISMLTGCTISGNEGGGVESDQGSMTLTDCTISGNEGGGVGNTQSTMTLTDCTVSGNTGSVAGGIYNYTDSITLTGTIVAGNTMGGVASDIGGKDPTDVTGTYNLIGTGGSGGIVGGSDGNIVLTDLSTLGLAPLGDYGGPTQTMALLPGAPPSAPAPRPISPARPNPITTDQRGSIRGSLVRYRRRPGQPGRRVDGGGGGYRPRQLDPARRRRPGRSVCRLRDQLRPGRVHRRAGDHAGGHARTEQRHRDDDDHRPGGGRDRQRGPRCARSSPSDRPAPRTSRPRSRA